MLASRGVHEPVAARLVERFGEDVVKKQMAHYDQMCARGEGPRGVGWLVKAIEEGYSLPVSQDAASKRFTYQEMLAWCEARGDLRLTRKFDPVRQEGKTLFVLRDSRDL